MVVGEMEIRLRADIARLQRDMDDARRVVGNATAGMERAANLAKGALGAIAGALSIGAFASWIKGAIDAGDAANKLSQKTGIAVKDIAGIQLAYQQAGIGGDAMASSMSRLSKGMVEGSKTLDALGIKSRNLDGTFKSTKDVLYTVADSFANMDNGAQKTALALELFGKSGADMIPLLNGGSGAMREMDEMARKLGLTISEETASKAEKFNDTLDLIQMGGQGVARGIAAELLPTLSNLAGSFLTSMTEGDKLKKTAEFLAAGLKILYTVGVGIVEVFSTVGKTIGAAGAQIVAILSGDFKMAAQIGREWSKDIGESWASTAKAISAAWSTSGNASVESMAMTLKATKVITSEAAAAVKIDAANKKALADEDRARLKAQQEIADAQAKAEKQVADAVGELDGERLKAYASAIAEAEANELLVKTFGKTKAQIEAMELARMEDRLSQRASLELDEKEVAQLERLIDAKQRNAAAVTQLGVLDTSSDVAKAKELLDILVAVDNATKSAADGMAASFGRVGSAIGGLTVALSEYGVRQQAIVAQMAAAKADPKNGPDKIAKMEIAAAHASAQAKIKSYGDMAGAAKGFFSENSKGYKVMETTERAFRAYEMAMAIESMITKLTATSTVTTAVVAGKGFESAAMVGAAAVDTATTGVSVANSATKAIASTTAGVAKAFEQMGVWGFVGAAAIIAFMGKMGVFGGTGGGGPAATTFEDRQKTQGTGTVLGDDSAKSESVSKSLEIMEKNSSLELGYQNSMLQALRNIETALGGAAKGIFQTAGLTGGSAFGTTNSSTKSFFGSDKSTTITDTGVRFTGSLGDLRAGDGSGTQYEDVTRTSDGGWFRGNKTSSNTNTKALSDAALKPFTLIFDNMGELLVGAGVKLGADSASLNAAINQISIDFAVSTRELKGQDLVDALSAGVGVAFDQVTAAVFPHMEKFQKVGEGMGETLVRVASEYSALDATLGSIGMTFGVVGMGSLEARDRLTSLVGGIDKLAEQTSSFAENFLTEAERLAPIQKHVTEQLAAMGLAHIKTRDDFKAAVLGLQEGAMLATKAGAETFAGLMALESAFAKVTPAAEDMTEVLERQAQAARDAASGLLSGVDDAFSVLQRVVGAEKDRLTKAHEVAMKRLQTSIDTETAAIAKHRALSDAIKSTISQIAQPDRASAQAQIQAAIAIAKASGVLPSADSLKDALSVLSRGSSDQFSTMVDFQRDQSRTQNSLAELGKLTDSALSVEERTLATLEAQKEAVQAAYDSQIGLLDETLAAAQSQIDVLKGIDTSVLSVAQAVEALALALTSARGNPIIGATAGINNAYQSALGRAPDAAGLQFWQDKAAAGVPTSDILDAITKSPEARLQSMYGATFGRAADAGGLDFFMKQIASGTSYSEVQSALMQSDEYKKRIPGFANGGYHFGGARIVGENGPELEVTGPASYTSNRELMSALRNPADNNAVLVSAIERLTSENAAMRKELNDALYAIAKSTRVSADYHDKADTIGTPPVRTGA